MTIQTSELFLVAHKAHGAATFDVAIRQRCANCEAIRQGLDESSWGCDECDGTGYWWITSTGGWRVYPWWHTPLTNLAFWDEGDCLTVNFDNEVIGPMPEGARELYNPLASREAKPTKQSSADGKALLASLGLSIQPTVTGTLKRRI